MAHLEVFCASYKKKKKKKRIRTTQNYRTRLTDILFLYLEVTAFPLHRIRTNALLNIMTGLHLLIQFKARTVSIREN